MPLATEQIHRAFARAHLEDELFIEHAIKFGSSVLDEFNRMVREGVQVLNLPEVEERS